MAMQLFWCLSLLLTFFIPSVFSATLNTTVATKAWFSNWNLNPKSNDPSQNASATTIGVGINLSYQAWLGGIQYYQGSGYAFDDDNVDRRNLDLYTGYRVSQYISPFVGLKYSQFSYNTDPSKTYIGAAIGFMGQYTIPQLNIHLSTNIAYTRSTSDDASNLTGPAFEFNAAHQLGITPLHVIVGYKFQQYSNALEKSTFSGITLSLSYLF